MRGILTTLKHLSRLVYSPDASSHQICFPTHTTTSTSGTYSFSFTSVVLRDRGPALAIRFIKRGQLIALMRAFSPATTFPPFSMTVQCNPQVWRKSVALQNVTVSDNWIQDKIQECYMEVLTSELLCISLHLNLLMLVCINHSLSGNNIAIKNGIYFLI